MCAKHRCVKWTMKDVQADLYECGCCEGRGEIQDRVWLSKQAGKSLDRPVKGVLFQCKNSCS